MENTTISSYIDPSYPFLLLSTTKKQYSRLRDLNTCKKITEEDYLCSNAAVFSTTERPVCETLLRTHALTVIPADCPTRNINANLEIWHPLSPNTWLYAVSQTTSASISCNKINFDIVDAYLNGVGIFQLNSGCKAFTFSSILYSTSNYSANYTNFIPKIDISKDDCCIQPREFLKSKSIQMEPLTLNNLNLNELRHSQLKLDQLEKILDENPINSNYFSSSWLSTTVAVIFLIIIALIFLCCCCNCSWLPVIGKFFPRRPKYCGIPSICITNHNERFELNERQFEEMSLRRLKALDDEDEDGYTLPHHTNLSVNRVPRSQDAAFRPKLSTRPALRRSTRESLFQI